MCSAKCYCEQVTVTKKKIDQSKVGLLRYVYIEECLSPAVTLVYRNVERRKCTISSQ